MRWRLLTASFVVLVLCGISLGAAYSWAATSRPVGAYVTDCVAGGCDYHWTTNAAVFADLLPGGPWPDGHPVRLWVSPSDPLRVDATKNVLGPVLWFAVFGLGLLAWAVAVPGRGVWLFGGRTRRAVGIGIGTVVVAIAVAALPSVAIVVQASRRPPVSVPALTAYEHVRPVLTQVKPLDAADDLDAACAAAMGPPTGAFVVDSDVSTDTSTIQLTGPSGRAVTRTLPGVLDSVATSPDALATADTNGAVRLYDAAATRLTAIIVDDEWINSVVFSPDGRTLAVATETGVRLWDVPSLRATATVDDPNAPWRVAFGADGHTVLSCDEDSQLRRWRI